MFNLDVPYSSSPLELTWSLPRHIAKTPTEMPASRFRLRLALLIGIAGAACGAPSPPASQTGASTPAPPAPQATPAAEADQRLAAEVTRFLDAWVIKHQPQAAVEGKMSAAFSDRRFVPAAALSPAVQGTGGAGGRVVECAAQSGCVPDQRCRHSSPPSPGDDSSTAGAAPNRCPARSNPCSRRFLPTPHAPGQICGSRSPIAIRGRSRRGRPVAGLPGPSLAGHLLDRVGDRRLPVRDGEHRQSAAHQPAGGCDPIETDRCVAGRPE